MDTANSGHACMAGMRVTQKPCKNHCCTIAKKKKMSIEAVCSALKRYLHLRKDADTKYPNATQRYWLEGLLVV